jgi:hypothetical protein
MARAAVTWPPVVATGFDHLVIATGAVAVRPPLPGCDAAGVLGVQTLDERPIRTKNRLSALRPLCAGRAPSGESSPAENVLAREPITVIELPTPQTASQTVKCSLTAAAAGGT